MSLNLLGINAIVLMVSQESIALKIMTNAFIKIPAKIVKIFVLFLKLVIKV
jgi:hypothetical protein